MAKEDARRGIIGTFHKTGSVLWQRICEAAGREGVFRHWNLDLGDADPGAEVVLSLHAHRARSLLAEAGRPVTKRDRWLISIRDPRDLILSAAHYHGTTKEAWCHRPLAEFGGQSYQEKINSYSNLSDRFLFEMENSAGRAIRNMTAMRRELRDETALFVRLEDLLQDRDLETFRASFAFLGFEAGQLADLLAIAVEASFFSDPRALKRSTHARAGRVAEFQEAFDDRVLARFHAVFPDSLSVLGYPEAGVPSRPEAPPGAGVRNWPARRPPDEFRAKIARLEDEVQALSARLDARQRSD